MGSDSLDVHEVLSVSILKLKDSLHLSEIVIADQMFVVSFSIMKDPTGQVFSDSLLANDVIIKI